MSLHIKNEILVAENLWKAVAILWVLLFHCRFDIPVIREIAALGYGGVDIFFFASGIGCYYSLRKDNEIRSFILKRIRKIIPIYFIVVTIWLFFISRTTTLTGYEIAGNYFCIGWLLGLDNQFNWYMNGIWLTYLLAPLFFNVVERRRSCVVTFIFTIALGALFVGNDVLMIVSRVPIFFFGMIAGRYISTHEQLSLRNIISIMLCGVCGLIIIFITACVDYSSLWDYGLWWYPFILITPGLCLAISVVFLNLCKHKCMWPLIRVLDYIGQHTYELYLAHVAIFTIVYRLIDESVIFGSNTLWIGLIIFSFIIQSILVYINEFLHYKVLIRPPKY